MLITVPVSAAEGDEAEAAAGETAAAETTESSDTGADDGVITDASEFDTDIDYRTEQEALDTLDLIAENDKMQFYYGDKGGSGYGALICLVDKATGKRWFSSPINAAKAQSVTDDEGNIIAQYENPKSVQLNQVKSVLEGTYATVSERRETNFNSFGNMDVTSERIDNGVRVTGSLEVDKPNGDTPGRNIIVPIEYTLTDDYLKVSIDIKSIKEENGNKLLTELAIMKTFGAGDVNTDGYFVIPDGSGAVIDFNNGKSNLTQYSAMIYGRDITKVPVIEARQPHSLTVSLPVFGIVQGNSGLMAVAAQGDASASVNAYVAGQNKKVYYNAAFFEFTTRTSDDYTMNGTQSDATSVTVYEKYGIKIPQIEVRYYPVSDGGNAIDYTDIAAKYRDYLKNEKNVTVSEHISDKALYLEFTGGVMKRESILGIPVDMQFPVTTYEQAKSTLEKLKAENAGKIVATYSAYTSDSIKNQVSTDGKPSGKLGGNGDFKKLLEYANGADVSIFPAVSNNLFNSGNGYLTVTDTAMRVTGQFSRQVVFDLAHGTVNQYYKSLALLTPGAYDRMFEQIAESYRKKGYTGASVGGTANTLYGDYSRSYVGRTAAMDKITAGYQKLKDAGLDVIAADPNAYVLPYADHVTDIPTESSGYDLFDYDIPFYQLVLSGLKPVSTTAVNGDPRMSDAILKTVAAGGSVKFDMIGTPAEKIKDTRIDNLYYAYADDWITEAAAASRFVNDVLTGLEGQSVIEHVIDGNIIRSTFENGTTLTVDLNARTVDKNGTLILLYDYIGKEVIG
jgi:hypothetical protein